MSWIGDPLPSLVRFKIRRRSVEILAQMTEGCQLFIPFGAFNGPMTLIFLLSSRKYRLTFRILRSSASRFPLLLLASTLSFCLSSSFLHLLSLRITRKLSTLRPLSQTPRSSSLFSPRSRPPSRTLQQWTPLFNSLSVLTTPSAKTPYVNPPFASDLRTHSLTLCSPSI